LCKPTQPSFKICDVHTRLKSKKFGIQVLTFGIIGLFNNALLTALALEHQIIGLIRMTESEGCE
jgi:hypothetical protein